jgi:hypothetical protein
MLNPPAMFRRTLSIKGTLSADGKTTDAVYNGQSLITMKKTEDPLSDK